MKSTIFRLSFLAAVAAGATASTAYAEGVSVTPYSFCGRVVDGAHAAFDADRAATLAAYDGSGSLLATSTTFFRSGSSRNYGLDIPMATSEVDGYATQNEQLTISVTDADGAEWSGVVPLSESIVREPGGVKELDIVLCSPDEETNGIDFDLYWSLYLDWVYSDYYDSTKDFDPNADYDGDGMSTIDEAYAGTNPFDPASKLAIVAYAHSDASGEDLAFTTDASRAYIVEGATSLEGNDWKALSFTPEGSTADQSVFVTPSSYRSRTLRVFLKPAADGPRFFRVRTK